MIDDLHAAKRRRRDEFFTQLTDIEEEMQHYERHFAGKVVYCNCDDPRTSNFVKYFFANFARLGLTRLLASCYKDQQRDLFSQHEPTENATWMEYCGNQVTVRSFIGNGDFRNLESVELLRQADIVVTNPPFSLVREFLPQLLQHGKEFLVIGNMNAITYEEVFPFVERGAIWYGVSRPTEFGFPSHYPRSGNNTRIDPDGNRLVSLNFGRWFTNLEHGKRPEPLALHKLYTSEEYPRYDDFDAINVDRVEDIPLDWTGLMGVPITFFDQYNPEQFEIVGATFKFAGYTAPTIGGKRLYKRLIVRNRTPR